MVIVAGEHIFGETEGSEQKIQVENVFLHPQYNEQTHENDIALIELAIEMVFDDYTQPACLPEAGEFCKLANLYQRLIKISSRFFINYMYIC